MSRVRKTYDPQIFSVEVLPGHTRTQNTEARQQSAVQHDLQELQRLIRVLERHAPVGESDARRDLEVVDEPRRMGNAEPHLRAVNALLVTLATYQKTTSRPRRAGRQPRPMIPPTVTLVPAVNGRSVDNGVPVEHDNQQLAAAAAQYIARDLVARQLTEFTSAEGYRLARDLAKLGDVEAPVEQLLSEASKVRLHPMPLADALSHSSH